MLIWILQLLSSYGIKVPLAFSHFTTRMLLCSVSSWVMTIALGAPFIRRLCAWKIGHTVRVTDCAVLSAQYNKSQEVPTMGGSLFITTITLNALIFLDWTAAFSYILVFTLLFLGLLGGIDDYRKLQGIPGGVSPREKMLFQIALSALIAGYLLIPSITEMFSGVTAPMAKEHVGRAMEHLSTQAYAARYYIPFFKNPIILSGMGLLGVFFMTLFVISGSVNSVNLADGLDGLATGCVMLVASVLALVAFLSNHVTISEYLNILYIEKSGEIAIFLCAVIGASLGFLWYNGFPAQVFMGDMGSMALGGVIGVSAVLLRREFLLALVGGIFVFEALSVMVQVLSFRFRKKRVFLCAPIHHHFEMKGLHETKIVLRFWMVGLILALIGIMSLKFQ